MSRRTAVLALGAMLALPGVASAATIGVVGPCLEQNTIVPVAGSGFSPNAAVPISGAATSSTGLTDATGTFGTDTTILTPANDSFTPTPVTLTAVDPNNPAVTATTGFQVVKLGSNVPLTGKPGAVTTWRFAGFTGGTIYGHFRYHAKTVRNYRFGKAQGPCGTLKTRARRLPAKSRPGTWTLQIDTKKSYDPNTRPAFKTKFTITRRFF